MGGCHLSFLDGVVDFQFSHKESNLGTRQPTTMGHGTQIVPIVTARGHLREGSLRDL